MVLHPVEIVCSGLHNKREICLQFSFACGPSVLADCSHPDTRQAFPFFSQLQEAQELGFCKCRQMEASRSVEAIREFLPPSSAGLLSLGVWLFLLIFTLHLGFVRLSAFLFRLYFAAICRSVQSGVTWLIIVWNQTFHIEAWLYHDDSDGTSYL